MNQLQTNGYVIIPQLIDRSLVCCLKKAIDNNENTKLAYGVRDLHQKIIELKIIVF